MRAVRHARGVVAGGERMLLRLDRGVRSTGARVRRAARLAVRSRARRLRLVLSPRQTQWRQVHRCRARRTGRSLRRRTAASRRHQGKPLQRSEDRAGSWSELVRELLLEFADCVLLAVSRLRRHADPGHEARTAVDGRERRGGSAVR